MANDSIGQVSKKDLWTIPNLITYFRILCIPVYITLMAFAGINNDTTFLYIALGVFFVAAGSDLVDGWVARKFNMQSGIGMVLDPFADKMMHISVLFSLSLCTGLTPLGEATKDILGNPYYIHYVFVALIFLKEAIMLSATPLVLKKGATVKANMMGKVASVFVSVGIMLAFFHPYVYFVDWAILGIGVILNYAAMFNYLHQLVVEVKLINSNQKQVNTAESIKEEDIRIVAEKKNKK